MIQINLLRVSPDSKYLEFSVECPTNYIFNVLNIYRHGYENINSYPINSEGWVDASAVYSQTSTKEIIRINTDIFGGSGLYKVEFGVEWTSTTTSEPVDPCNGKLSDNPTFAMCSDVTFVYEYIIGQLTSSACKCGDVSDEVKRIHAILYGHEEAMRLEKWIDAINFYETLESNLSICKSTRTNSNCGCNG